jgi:hypothetical protein
LPLRKASLALALALPLTAATSAHAAVGSERTDGPNYDRNPSVVQDGNVTDLFFARSQQPCNRLAGCDADNSDYDLYVKQSTNGGKDYGPAQLAATNVDGAGPFRGRTIAATRAADGTVHVFWASGANSIPGLFHIEETGSGWTAPQLVPGTNDGVFNVEALSRGGDIFLYTEECCSAPGVHAYRFVGGAAVDHTLVSAGKNLPKGIVDSDNGSVRLTYTDAMAYPQVDVYVNTSADGLTFAAEQLVVSEPGASHWDPALAQRHNGKYELYTAPDREQGAGRQQVANTQSNDFVRWSKPHDLTPGFKGGIEYWDYWPEPFVLGNKLTLYYTSERATNTQATGTGHIWTDPGQGGNG